MSNETMSNQTIHDELGIHGKSSYIDFEFTFFTLPMLLLIFPVFYLPPTAIINLRIFYKLLIWRNEKHINVHLFKAICMSQLMSYIFFTVEFLNLRLPATGVFTSWCASVDPNRFLIILYILDYYIGYAAMLFPILISLMRLVLVLFPQNHEKINGIILKSSIPIIAIYPIFFTFFMFPAVGYCYQPSYPFVFGGILTHFNGTWFGLKNNYFLLYNNLFWMFICGAINAVLLVKLIMLKIFLSSQVRSNQSYKIELSLTLTTVAMFFFYLSNGLVVICAQLLPAYTYFAIMLRPFGNDLESCVVPWVFYLTHPVFRRNRRRSTVANVLVNS